MKRLIGLFIFLAMATSVAHAETVVVSDHFDDDVTTTNTNGIGSFSVFSGHADAPVNEADSKVTIVNNAVGWARASIASVEGAAIGEGISRFEFKGVSFAQGNSATWGGGGTARLALSVKDNNVAEDLDGGLDTGFWIQIMNTSLTTSGLSGAWDGTSALIYNSSTDVKTVLATWTFDTLNWSWGTNGDSLDATSDFSPVLNFTLDLTATGYSLNIEGDTVTMLSGSLSDSYATAGITNELTTGYAYVIAQTEEPSINTSIDQVVITENAVAGAAANTPTPSNGELLLLEDITDLSWMPGEDPNLVSVNSYELIFSTDSNYANPDAFVGTYQIPAGTTSFNLADNSIFLDYGTTYYWRVNSDVTWDSAEITTNPINGSLWTFTTIGLAPVIVTNPVNTLADADGNATFTGAGNITTTDYRWFKEGTGILSDGGVFSGTQTNTLTITGATAADEGLYYFIAYNGDPDDGGVESLPSSSGKLWTRRLTSHFEFETLVDGSSPDSVDGFDLTMNNLTPEGEEPVADAELVAGLPEIGGNALSFGGNDGVLHSGNFGAIEPGVVDYEDITISLWVYRAGGSAWQRIIDCGNDTNNYIFITGSNGDQCRFAAKNGSTEYFIATAAIPENTWTHVAAVLDGNTGRLYINGTMVASGNMPVNPVNFSAVNNYLGRSNYDDSFFNGIIDDLKIYCYARSTEQIALDYLALKGGWICDRENYDLVHDFNNDCEVDILDFAQFAATWMDTFRIYPVQQ